MNTKYEIQGLALTDIDEVVVDIIDDIDKAEDAQDLSIVMVRLENALLELREHTKVVRNEKEK
ncbi:MAG TPA: hypothetical protein EYN66_12455 [Myxococcales bacterium]|nr:hypothetical protein [Myxococcales bacterium]